MVEFDGSENPWEDAPMVVPCGGLQITAEKLNNMLRGGGHIKGKEKVKSCTAVPLALQGVLSQTFRLEVEYKGKPDLPPVFIAKFLNPVRENGHQFSPPFLVVLLSFSA